MEMKRQSADINGEYIPAEARKQTPVALWHCHDYFNNSMFLALDFEERAGNAVWTYLACVVVNLTVEASVIPNTNYSDKLALMSSLLILDPDCAMDKQGL